MRLLRILSKFNQFVCCPDLIVKHADARALQTHVSVLDGVRAVRARDAPPPRLLLGVGEYVRLQVGGLRELLITTLQNCT